MNRLGDDLPFGDLIGERTGADHVDRGWLSETVLSALDAGSQIVLVTGEPGSGKTSMACALAKQHPEWMRYFIRYADRSVRETAHGSDGAAGVEASWDIASVLFSIGFQFSRQRPEAFDVARLKVVVKQDVGMVAGSVVGIRADEVEASPFVQKAIHVTQHADRVDGELIGARIRRLRLEPRLLEPANLSQMALVGPAMVLLDIDPTARIVILLDGLDIATRADSGSALFAWLCEGLLPKNIQLVITSREIDDLHDLETLRPGVVKRVRLDPDDERVGRDLLSYAQRQLTGPVVESMMQSRGMLLDQFHREVVRRARGNFLYLASYARALRHAAGNDDELASQLVSLDGLPSGIEGLYAKFVTMVRRDLRALKIDASQREAQAAPTEWEALGQPLLGVLTVVQAPVLVDQLTVFAGIRRPREDVERVLRTLRWLLEAHGERLALFHESIAEFLAGEQTRQQYPNCHIVETYWHTRIVTHYRAGAGSWTEVNWTNGDPYGLAHISYHLERQGQPVTTELTDLISPGLRQAIRTNFGTEQHFLRHLDRAAGHIARNDDIAAGLPRIMYLGVVRNQASRVVAVLPPRALGLMARLGRVGEAIDLSSEIGSPEHRFAGHLEIMRHAPPGDASARDLLELLVESGLSAGLRPTQIAARVVALQDLDRALRLWGHAFDSAAAGRNHDVPDALYRAAARTEPDVERALEFIARIEHNRTDAYLDLVRRADPAHVVGVIEAAEQAAADLRPAPALVVLARLAAAWAPHDVARSQRSLARLRAQAFAAATEEKFSDHLVTAAATVGDVDRLTARMLLSALDGYGNGYITSACERGVELWTRWSEPAKARALVNQAIRGIRTRDTVDVALAFARLLMTAGLLDRARYLERLDRASAVVPALSEVSGAVETHDRDRSLASLSRAFAPHDADRAATAAKEITRVIWAGLDFRAHHIDVEGLPENEHELGNPDRYSLLAQVAHIRLDHGDCETAAALLDEILRAAGEVGSLGTSRTPWESASYRRAADGPPPDTTGRTRHLVMRPIHPIKEGKSIRHHELEGMMAIFNSSNSWSARTKRYFFREPADMVRMVSFGPYNLARTVRLAAEHWAERRLKPATSLVRAITEPGERAIGLARLHQAAHDPGDGPEAVALSRELDRAIEDLDAYAWTTENFDADARGWAYIRPDYRVRFELAIRAYGCRAQDWDAIHHLKTLFHVFRLSVDLNTSRLYVQEFQSGESYVASLAKGHEALLTPGDGDSYLDVARAQAAYHEFLMHRLAPGHRSAAPRVRISDPIYAAVVDLVTPEPGAPLSPAFESDIAILVEQQKLPAAAGLVAFAAEIRPDCRSDLHRVAAHVIAATADATAGRRVDTLASMVAAPGLEALIDPVELMHEAERCVPDHLERWVPGNAQARIFPVLLAQLPTAALLKLYRTLSQDWEAAMELLERAVTSPALDLNVGTVPELAAAIRRGMHCVTDGVMVLDTVDGVNLTLLDKPLREGDGSW